MTLSQQIITDTALILILVLLILALAYLSFKTLIIRTAILVSIVAFVAVSTCIIIEKLDFNSFLDQQKSLTYTKVSNIRSRLENQIQADLQISKAIIIYMQSKNFQFTNQEFNSVAHNILDSAPRISHFAIAKDLIVNRVYPSEGNTKAIGLNYRQNTEQWPSIERAITSHKTLLAGPVNLVQGGVAVIGRIPIYFTNETDHANQKLWGLVSVVIDMHSLFDAAGLNEDNELLIALRGVDALGADGDVFSGDENLFSQQPILQNITLPEGSWQIAAVPTAGWPISSPTKLTIRISVFSFFLLASFFIIFRASQHQKQARINKKLVREITERKQLEIEQQDLTKNLYQAQKLEAIGKLTGGIAHDFNNILAAITGYTQLSQILVEKNSEPEKLSQHLGEIIKASDRAKSLVQQMMAFSRGKDIISQPISPNAITKETVIMLASTIPSTIRLTANYSDINYTIKSDPIQFQQIIINVIVNSRDAISEQVGEISICISKEILDNKQCSSCKEIISEQYLQILIKDNGSGISGKDIENIFNPFYSTKEVGKGAGMGLSVVHGIVHAAAGHIILTSSKKSGTTVKLLFPILDTIKAEIEDEVSNVEPQKIPLNKSNSHVLIIDDEESITSLYEDLLLEMDMKSSVFNDPINAISFFKLHKSDITLVVTDQTMPKMTGTELSSTIKQLAPNIPIILCSGNTEIIDEEKRKISGVSVFLQKPVDLSLLANEIINFH